MNKPVDTVFRLSFSVFLLALAAGIYFLVNSRDAYLQATVVGSLASSVLVICALWEVLSSTRVQRSEKTTWTLAFLVGNVIAVAFYFLAGRKRIAGNQEGEL